MAPHAEAFSADQEDQIDRMPAPPRPAMSTNPPRVLIVGAGSRGNAYARETGHAANGVVVAVAEPISYKRRRLGEKYIWGKGSPSEGQEFESWKQYLAYETERRARAARGESVPEGIDAVFICVLDEMHKEVIIGLAPLGLHMMCEKPLTTNIDDCVAIYKSLLPDLPYTTTPSRIFSIGHVLRYSQHNIVLRKLLLEDNAIGDILSVEHTEPVGWWHFAHSFVRYIPIGVS
jgi:predicted dehydrogenase